MAKLFCISDIHGHLTELEEAMGRIREKAAEGDKLILLGDYIDNGPGRSGSSFSGATTRKCCWNGWILMPARGLASQTNTVCRRGTIG